MNTYFLLIVCATCAALKAGAQETPTITPPLAPVVTSPASNEPELTLDELIRLAQQNSPRLTIAQENQEAARHRAAAARAGQNPTLLLVPGIGGTREARDEEVILAQPLDVSGLRRARAGIATSELRRAEAESNLVTRTLIIEVKNAASTLFAAQEAESMEQVQVEIAQLFRDAAARRAELGDVPPVQVQRAELELLRLQNDLSNAQAERLTRRAALNQLIGQAPATPLRVTLPLDATAVSLLRAPVNSTGITTSVPAASSPITAAQHNTDTTPGPTTATPTRLDVASAQATLEVRQAQAQAARREGLPSIELQARRSTFFGRNGSYALRAVVTMPLFDFGARKGERRALEAEARAQAATVKLLEQQAASQMESARLRLDKARQNVTRYREKLLSLTLDLLRKTQIGYAQGASTYLEVLEAQRTLQQVQSEYLQSLMNVQAGETALEAAQWIGISMPESRSEVGTERGIGSFSLGGANR